MIFGVREVAVVVAGGAVVAMALLWVQVRVLFSVLMYWCLAFWPFQCGCGQTCLRGCVGRLLMT